MQKLKPDSMVNYHVVGSTEPDNIRDATKMMRVLSGIPVSTVLHDDRIDVVVFSEEDGQAACKRIDEYINNSLHESNSASSYLAIVVALFFISSIDYLLRYEDSGLLSIILSVISDGSGGISGLFGKLNLFIYWGAHGSFNHLMSNLVAAGAGALVLSLGAGLKFKEIALISIILGALAILVSSALFSDVYTALDPTRIYGLSGVAYGLIGAALGTMLKHPDRAMLKYLLAVALFALFSDFGDIVVVSGAGSLSAAVHVAGLLSGLVFGLFIGRARAV